MDMPSRGHPDPAESSGCSGMLQWNHRRDLCQDFVNWLYTYRCPPKSSSFALARTRWYQYASTQQQCNYQRNMKSWGHEGYSVLMRMKTLNTLKELWHCPSKPNHQNWKLVLVNNQCVNGNEQGKQWTREVKHVKYWALLAEPTGNMFMLKENGVNVIPSPLSFGWVI